MADAPLPVMYVSARPKTRAEKLLDCALSILDDGCPADPDRYICQESDFYDETACHRCWVKYLFAVANGEA